MFMRRFSSKENPCQLYIQMMRKEIINKFYSTKNSVRPRIQFRFKAMQELKKTRENSHKNVISQVSSELLDTKSITAPNTKSNIKNKERVYGIYPVLLALQSQRRSFIKLYYKEDVFHKNDKMKEIYRLCQMYNIPSLCVNKNKLGQLIGAENVNQGVCLEASTLPFIVLEDLIDRKDFVTEEIIREKYKIWLYLDQINDPMNLGAILRTSYYLGVDKIFTSKINSCPITSVVSKASSGVAEIVCVYQVNEVDCFLKGLQKQDWLVIASSATNKGVSLEEFKPTKNILLIVGNEGRGISREVENLADEFITIPPNSNCVKDMQCLNVSVATSILLYSLLSKLKANKI